ncbi:MAG: YncE family protein, partial [Actinomycetes bacterium]
DCTSLQPVACDLGKYLRVVITETNGSGSASAPSDGHGPVAEPAAAIGAAQVGGTVAIGEQLYAVSEGVTGDPYPTESYQWQISTDGVTFTDIYGAISDTYAPSVSEYQQYLRVIITEANDLGTASATSPATTPVDRGSPRNPTFDTPVKSARGFTVNVTNYDPAWTWTPTTSVGTLILGTPSGSILPITIKRLSPGATATVTVNTTQSVYYYDGTGSVTGSSYATNTVIATIDNGVGTTPQGIAIDPAGQFAYVANHSSASVSKIAVTTNTVVDTVNVGSGPTSIVVDQAGQFAYVTNADSDTLSKIDLSTFSVTRTVGVNNNPTGIAIDPLAASSPSTRNFAYVATGDGTWWSSTATMDKIDLSSMQVVDSKDIGNSVGPQYVAIDPAGSYAYVNASADWWGTYNDVTRVALPGMGSTSQVTVGSTPMGIAIDPAGSYAYVANSGATTASRINLSSFTSGNVTTISGMGTTPNGMGVSPVGSFAYVTNKGAGTVTAIKLSTSPPTAASPAITVGAGPFDDATTPDGEYTYVTNSTDGTVSVIYSGLDIAPTISGASISGTAQVGQVLTAIPGTVTGVPVPTESYQWQSATASGGSYSNISGATGVTYTPVASDYQRFLKVVITETNYLGSASATSSATSSVTAGAALTPTFDTPVRTASGFTVNVTNYDNAFTWPTPTVTSGSVVAGLPFGSVRPYTVSGLSAGASSTLTVTTTQVGYVSGTASVSGAALNAAL